MNTLVIELYGGPGSGKSTIAAGLYYNLKKTGVSSELVREYVKKWAWDGILPKALDQLYITGKQSKAEHMLYGKVRVIVTDCPLYMGVFYDKKYNNRTLVREAVDQFHADTNNQVDRLRFVLNRTKAYDSTGRYCSEESAQETDVELVEFLVNNKLDHTQLLGDTDHQVATILSKIREKL